MSGLEEGFKITLETDDIIDFSSFKKGVDILRNIKLIFNYLKKAKHLTVQRLNDKINYE